MSPPPPPEPRTSTLPESVEERCYEIWFDGPPDERARAIARLCDEHAPHATDIRALAGRLARGDGMLGDVLDEPAPPPPKRIGAYDIVGELGRGGFGTVYRARQIEPVQRDVALKVLHPGRQNERAIARFSTERQALARMQHATIAKVFARLEATFDQLPAQYQEVITLARIVGLPHAEIAQQLGRTPGAVRTMLGRAVARLAELHEGPG